ncbi:hypothetical protein B0H10DRAFT_1944855 [Mycena sp. CBHHK59/15]|nr:hypothetical protein B0H10DRAFT_1944855 [Mycena sp. CBHHK59/15]
MANWIGETQTAEHSEQDTEADDDKANAATPHFAIQVPAWKLMTLETLFLGEEPGSKLCWTHRPSTWVMEEEEMLIETLANAAEDDIPDNGAIEVDSKRLRNWRRVTDAQHIYLRLSRHVQPALQQAPSSKFI